MSILVTGGAGYIGSHMVYALADVGERVVVLDNLSTGFDWAIANGVPLIVGDTGDQNLVAHIIREHNVDSVVHFAAQLVVPDSVKDPLGYYKNNTVNSRALVETAVNTGVRQFIFSSTCAVYGNPPQVPVTEGTPPAPISPYGWSKLMTEIMLRDAGTAHDLHYVILRYFNVAGADPNGRTGQSTKNATQLIKVAVEAALGLRSQLDIYGTDYPTPDGTCIRDYIHVSDLARAHLDALRYLRADGGSVTLNCGYGHGFSVRQVVDMVRGVSGVDFKVEIGPRRPGDPAQIIAASERARAILGWTPQYDDIATIIGSRARLGAEVASTRAYGLIRVNIIAAVLFGKPPLAAGSISMATLCSFDRAPWLILEMTYASGCLFLCLCSSSTMCFQAQNVSNDVVDDLSGPLKIWHLTMRRCLQCLSDCPRGDAR